jgi:hypothetical protein
VKLRTGLRQLLTLPAQFVPALQEEVVRALEAGSSCPSSSAEFPLVDCFLLCELLHPAVTSLDLDRVPSHLRHFTILNSVRAPRLQSLTLALSAPLPWSACFNPGQTSTFLAGLPRLQSLTLQDLADDSFLSLLAESAGQLARLDVQGSLGVTDRGLLCLATCSALRWGFVQSQAA